MPIALDLTGSPEEIEALIALAKEHHDLVEASEPMRLDASRAMNVGLVEVGVVLTFITVVFKTGTAVLEFLKAARDNLKDRGGTVALSESATGNALGQLKGTTPDQALTQIARA
jgi:hypothetical protein